VKLNHKNQKKNENQKQEKKRVGTKQVYGKAKEISGF